MTALYSTRKDIQKWSGKFKNYFQLKVSFDDMYERNQSTSHRETVIYHATIATHDIERHLLIQIFCYSAI